MTHPLYALPFTEPLRNDLEAEYKEHTLAWRLRARRKVWQREGLLRFTGQSARRRVRIPDEVRRLLIVYTWSTVGDSIMDLAGRVSIPEHVVVDLCIDPALAPLFATDARFRRVHVDPAAAGQGYDFVLLDCLSTRSIRLKSRYQPKLPFASLREHLEGERFDRAAFSDRRIRHLFGLAPRDPPAPSLQIPAAPRVDRGHRTRVAVVLGARVDYKHYRRWAAVLRAVVVRWPPAVPGPCFVLMGQGASALADLATFDTAFLAAHAIVAIDRGGLREAAADLAACDFFLGVDGGLMHVAAALGIAGVALFTRTDPRYFLRPGASIESLSAPGALDAVDPQDVAAALLARLRASSS